ncbi:MAG: alpha amylase family protein [Armatimonadota bacterium]
MNKHTDKTKVLWCDAEANLWALDSHEKVAELAGQCKEAGIDVIAVDVKPLTGVVLYNSRIAPRIKAWSGREYPENYDLLQVMVEEGHRAGIAVHASINVFAEASTEQPEGGAAIAHPEWQCIKYELDKNGKARLVPTSKAADQHFAIFVNPANQDVQAYELSIISEIISNYDVDGIVLDRMRYPGIHADFSELSKEMFEKWIGAKVERFPEDIFEIDPLPGCGVIRGKHFGSWMEWRAKVIHDFAADVRRTVKSIRAEAQVGVYVGSWYNFYYDVGVNWANPKHEPPYDFASSTYKDTGYGDLVDWICTGCYYPHPTREEARAAGIAEWKSVEAGCEESMDVVENEIPVYASLYLRDYKGKPDVFERAIDMALTKTQGVMLFDLVYLRDYGWWDLLKRKFSGKR